MTSQAEWKVRMDARRRFLGLPMPLVRAAVLALAVASCATPPAPEAMVPTLEQPAAGGRSEATLAIGEVTGGGDGDQASGVPFGRSSIDDDGFRAALASTMGQSGLFQAVAAQGRGAGDWRLDARLLSQEVSGAFDSDAQVSVGYVLTDARTGRALWTDTILTRYRLGLGEAMITPGRRRQALAGAVRGNLSTLAAELAAFVATPRRPPAGSGSPG